MTRDIKTLFDTHFDLLVIGGGIYGAWTAYDAALRGLNVALVEKHDWASGTSSASSKLIHGGLRYLEQFKFGLVKKSIDERAKLTRLGAHRVNRLRFIIPLYDDSRVGPLRLRAGLWIYDLLAGRKNLAYPHEFLSRKDTLARYPFLNNSGIIGGLTYGDCQTDDCRFTLEIVAGAYKSGVSAVNYVEVTDLIDRKNQITGVRAVDRVSGTAFDIQAKIVFNASGPWLKPFGESDKTTQFVRLTKGVHLVLPFYDNKDAILGLSKHDGRVFFIVPWYGHTLVGTTDTDFTGDPAEATITKEDVNYLLAGANHIVKDKNWEQSSIRGAFVGLRALRNEGGKAPSSITREWSLAEPKKHLLVSIGGKFTSARRDSAIIVDCVMRLLKKPNDAASPTETRPFPWSPPLGEFDDWQRRTTKEGIKLGLDQETAQLCSMRYGISIKDIYDIIRSDSSLARRIIPNLPFCKAEVVQGVKNEMALGLEDILRRRLPFLLLNPANRQVLEEVADLAAPLLNWTEEGRQGEINDTLKKWNTPCAYL